MEVVVDFGDLIMIYIIIVYNTRVNLGMQYAYDMAGHFQIHLDYATVGGFPTIRHNEI